MRGPISQPPVGKTLDEIHTKLGEKEIDMALPSDAEEKNVVEDGRQKRIIKYYNKQPETKEPIESLMIVPYVSTKTFPDYIRMMIESYDWMPQMVHYVVNVWAGV